MLITESMPFYVTLGPTQPAFTCSKTLMEATEQWMESVQN